MVPTDPDTPSESQKREGRQHPRTKIAVEVELQSERTATPFRVKTTDLGLGGFYVEMMFTLEVGTKLKIGLWLNDVKVSAGGIVVTRDLQVGNGIEFIDVATEDRLRLKRFLAAANDAQSSG
jgi:PilZ domain-containing protein